MSIKRKRNMYKRLIIFLIAIYLAGCGLIQKRWEIDIPIEGADIVFNTLIDDPERDGWKKDALGFYRFDTEFTWYVDTDEWLITPAYLSENKLMALRKSGNPGSINEFYGSIFIFTTDYYIPCGRKGRGFDIKPYKGNILINNEDGLSLISSKNCSVLEIILNKDQLKTIYHSQYFGPFALSENGNVLILDVNASLVGVDLTTQKRLFSISKGTNPAISPNQEHIAYVSVDGIHIMDIDGRNNSILINFKPFMDDFSPRGIVPRPNWSINGNELIYHKCIRPLDQSCVNGIEDYAIFIYDIKSRVEQKIVEGGVNPSWSGLSTQFAH